MTVRKHILTTLTILFLGLTPVIATVPAVYAATTTTTTQQNFLSGLIQFIAQKFGLDQNQVQIAVTDYANQHKATGQQNRQNREKAYLDSLVKNNTITASQEQQILSEQSKLRSEYGRSALQNLTPAERKQKFQQMQAEIQAWSKATGIDVKYLRSGFGMGRHMFGGWDNDGDHPMMSGQTTPTPGS